MKLLCRRLGVGRYEHQSYSVGTKPYKWKINFVKKYAQQFIVKLISTQYIVVQFLNQGFSFKVLPGPCFIYARSCLC